MMKEIRNLRTNEIEVRIAFCNRGGVELLLYKDARCDMAILDETFGPLGWQRKHSRDNQNCIVSVYDAENKQWIEKEDVGCFSSDMEKEKTVASDSFKRACVNWGIGRELYTVPSIFIRKEFLATYKIDESDNISCYDKFYVKDIEYNGKQIVSVTIADKNNGYVEVFEGDVIKSEPKKRGRKKAEPKETVEEDLPFPAEEETAVEETPFPVEDNTEEEDLPFLADEETVVEETPFPVEDNTEEEDLPFPADEEVAVEETPFPAEEETVVEEDLPFPAEKETAVEEDLPFPAEEEVAVEEDLPFPAEEETAVEEDLPFPADEETAVEETPFPVEEETAVETSETLSELEIPDDEVILFGNCLGMTYGEAKVLPKFKNFLKWVQKNPEKKYDREEQNIQFAKLKNIAEKEAVA